MAELLEEPEEQEKVEELDLRDTDAIIRSFTIPGAFHGAFGGSEGDSTDSTSSSVEPILEQHHEAEHITPTVPVPSSSTTSDTSGLPPQQSLQRQRRSKSSYRFAHPPRTIRQKKGILRPRVLLQLQEKSNSGFHKPVVEVVPGSRYSAKTRIGQKLQRFHRSKDGANADDLVVIRSERSSDVHSEEPDVSEVLGMIQPGEDGPSAWITLDNSVWKASLDERGSYSLEYANDPTQKVKWYIPKSKRSGTVEAGSSGEREFSFTTLLPDSKKHPVVANMSESGMQIYDHFSSPISPDETITTDDALRRLIIVSGAWVFFCEGWSTHYDFNSVTPRSAHHRNVSTQPAGLGVCSKLRTPSRSPASFDRAEDLSATLGEERSREISQSSEVSNLAGEIESQPVADPSLLQTSAVPSAAQSPTSLVPSSSEAPIAPPLSLPRAVYTADAEEKARKRHSWGHHEICPNLHHEVRGLHHRLEAVSRNL